VDDVQDSPVDDAVEPSAEPVDEPAGEPAGDVVEPAAPAISDALMERAKAYGLSGADFDGLDDARVERMFTAIDRRVMRPQTQPQVPGLPGAPAPALPGAPAPSPVPGAYAPLKIEFGDELDESLVGPIKTVVEHLNTQVQQIHAFRQQVQSELQAMNVLREFGEFDRFVTGLGEEWAPDYGVGATMDMDPQSSEFQKRLEVFHGARNLRTDATRRRQQLSGPNALTRSHRVTHWDRIAEQERNKINGKVAQRRRGAGERPVKGKQPAMSPREAAIEAMRQ
jgi:hypothetical protein